MKFVVRREPWAGTTDLYARVELNGVSHAVLCADPVIKKVDPGETWPRFLSLDDMFGGNTAQSLFDALWEAGYRPHNGESSQAHVDALKYHLEDMRRLAFPKERE